MLTEDILKFHLETSRLTFLLNFSSLFGYKRECAGTETTMDGAPDTCYYHLRTRWTPKEVVSCLHVLQSETRGISSKLSMRRFIKYFLVCKVYLHIVYQLIPSKSIRGPR